MRAAVEFQSFRARLIEHATGPAAEIVRVDLEPGRTPQYFSSPFAVIARLRTDSAAAKPFTIRVDGAPVCSPRVRGGAVRRVDCAWAGDWDPNKAHQVEITSAGSEWRVEYLELATHHGATRAYDLIVVPAGSHQATQPTLTRIAVAFLLIALLFLLPEHRMPNLAWWIHRGVSAGVCLLLLLVVLSSYVSSYTILLSLRAFVETVVILGAPRLWRVGTWVMSSEHEGVGPALAKSGVCATIVLAAYGSLVSAQLNESYRGNYSGFIHIARTAFDRNPLVNDRAEVRKSLVLEEPGGYDGQFMYFETFDPFLRRFREHPGTYGRFIDAPPYRFGRIGFSLLTKVFSFDQWNWYPATMTWLILGALFLSGLMLGLLARHVGASAAWGLVVLIIPGFWQSAQASLPEPIAAALLLAGYFALVNEQTRLAGLLFAASLLVRETGAIFVVSIAAATFMSGKGRRAVLLLFIAFVPVVVWRMYVGWILFPEYGARAFWFNANNLGTPSAGIADLWRTIHRGAYFPDTPEMARAGIFYPILLLGGLCLAVVAAARNPGAVPVAGLLYGIMAISLTYDSIWVHVGNGQRGTYELFVVLAVVSILTRVSSPLWRMSLVIFWTAAAAYTFFGTFEAESVRRAIIGYMGAVL